MSPVDYHAWTHLPKAQGGTDPIPIAASGGPYAYIVWEGSATATDDTPVLLSALSDFGTGYTSDPAITVDLVNARIVLDTAQGPGANALGGLWLAQLKVYFDATFAGDIWGRIDWTSLPAFEPPGSPHVEYQKAQDVIGGGSFVAYEMATVTSVMLVDDTADLNWITGAFVQQSGGNEGFGFVVLSACRLQPYPADAGELFP